MTTTEQRTRKALWVPGWYELDQPLYTGGYERFWFYQNPPADLPDVEDYDYVFFNQLSCAANCQVRNATIMSIEHPVLGSLRQIETDGLDYIFHPKSGEPLTVNAEEEPGKVFGEGPEIGDWSVTVMLTGVSDPVVDT
ncbi:MAG: hypothetical protein ACR2NP_15940 [Pirellulaceae bacterium]